MEYRITWSPEAVEDLESIAEYIGRDPPFYAQSVVSKILETSKKLKEFPLIGRVLPEINNEDIRERLIYKMIKKLFSVASFQRAFIILCHGKFKYPARHLNGLQNKWQIVIMPDSRLVQQTVQIVARLLTQSNLIR